MFQKFFYPSNKKRGATTMRFTSTAIDQASAAMSNLLKDYLADLEKAYLTTPDKFPVDIKLLFMPSDQGDLAVEVSFSFNTGTKIKDKQTVIINDKQRQLFEGQETGEDQESQE